MDEFSTVHPWQAPVQHAHVLAAPLLVFAIGLFWKAHATAGLRNGFPERRRSGTALVLAAAPMILSGSLIQTAVEPAWRTAWIAVHLAASTLWSLGALAHLLQRRRRNGSNGGNGGDSGGHSHGRGAVGNGTGAVRRTTHPSG